MAGWFIWREGETAGPFGSEELAREVLDGRVGADHWLWHADLGGWTRAGAFDFLARRLQNGNRRLAATQAAEASEPAESKAQGKRREAPPSTEISLTRLYLARLKREPLARLALEASTIEVITHAESGQPAAEVRGPDPLAERLATFLNTDAGPDDEMPSDASPAPSAGRPLRDAPDTAGTIVAGAEDGAGEASAAPGLVDLGIHVIRPVGLQPRPTRQRPPPLPAE